MDDAMIGMPCDDGDVCTTNDVYGNDCNCAGTFQDSDNDNVCDANDICPNGNDNADIDGDGTPDACDTCDGNLIGMACDDGNPCTFGETYDANCNCGGGTLEDADGDGVCDNDDICPNGDDNIDIDGDGTPDACDTCDDNLIGLACDDGDACTTGETYDANCNCGGGTLVDSDGDGVCDNDDICPNGNDNADIDGDGTPDACDTCDGNLIGMACDDGNPCTFGETYDANCNCGGGTLEDADGDGVCDNDDICPNGDDNIDIDGDGTPDACDTCDDNLIGLACDDGDACTTGETYDANCNCGGGTLVDSDGDGVCDADDQCPGSDDTVDTDGNGIPDGCDTDACPALDFNVDPVIAYDLGQDFGPSVISDNGATVYMDGNAWKAVEINYTVTPNTVIEFDFKSTLEGEIHEVGFDNELIVAPDHRIVVYGNQGYTGDFPNNWYNGSGNYQHFTIPIGASFTGTYQYLVLTADDDANAAGNSYYSNIRIFEDMNGDMMCDDGCIAGQACEDGDPCTIGETLDANCNCGGGTILDSDGDGICDMDDICPNLNDALIGTACDDGDACTTGDVYGTDCNCAGTYQDADGDGYCAAEDADDNDPCIPNVLAGGCGEEFCEVIIEDNFESGWGNWNDGGSDCYRYNGWGTSGSRSVRIRDNSGMASSMYSDLLDLSAYNSLVVNFNFYPNSMENGEDFMLEISTNGGSSYTTIQSWTSGVNFTNGVWYTDEVIIDGITLTGNSMLRLRCDASANGDQIYIDDVKVEGCGVAEGNSGSRIDNSQVPFVDNIKLYPNPADHYVRINFNDLLSLNSDIQNINIALYSMQGKEVFATTIDPTSLYDIDIAHLVGSQTYFIRIELDNGTIYTKKFMKF